MAFTLCINHRDFTCSEINALDSPAGVVVWLVTRKQETAAAFMPDKATVVARVTGTVGANGSAIGSTAKVCNDLYGTVWVDAAQGTPCNFHYDNRTIRHRYGALGELQVRGDFCDRRHGRLQLICSIIL
jgi:hypothetical protein